MTSKKLKVENWPIDKLIPYARNPRKNDQAVEQVAAAIREFGFRVPIVAKSDGLLVDGHLRLKAAQKLGLKEVPVVLADDLSDAQIKAFRISVNRMAELAEWDNELLALEFAELKDLGFDTSLTGFDEAMVSEIMPNKAEPLTDEDSVPEVDEQSPPKTKIGDVWILGNHKIMCGDSTDEAMVAKLMNGVKADMVFTDPPYNHASDDKGVAASVSKAHKNLMDSEWDKNFDIRKTLSIIDMFKSENSTVYICTSWHLAGDIWKWSAVHSKTDGYCVWHKPNPMPSLMKRHWTWASELICYATFGKHTFNFPDQGHASSVWTFTKVSKCDLHPTMKPISVPEHAITHSSKQGASVLDLFLGSGSTLIACEKTGRKCYGMELSPQYISIIIQRWQEYTGKEAHLEETGETFNSIASR